MEPFLKVNFDAAFVSDDRSIGIGIVIRNCRGDAEVVLAAPRRYVSFVFHAECYALLRGLQLCHELGYHHVIFEGDGKQVIDSIYGVNVECSWNGQLVEDIPFILLRHSRWKLVFYQKRWQ